MFWGVVNNLDGPPNLIHGCSKACSAERRFLGSFTRSFEIRSLASSEISLHSVSGKSKPPSWMEWKRSSWQALQGSPWFQPHWLPQFPLKMVKKKNDNKFHEILFQICVQFHEIFFFLSYLNGGYPHSKMYIMIPNDQRSHFLS